MRRPTAIALALLAIHAVNVSFLSLRPGVDPGDHVTAALASLAVLGLAWAALRRLPAGGRAAVALLFVPPAVVACALAAADASARGLSGADVTGLALGGAAALLLFDATTTLWRTRRHDGRPVLRRTLKTLGGIAVTFWVVAPLSLATVAVQRPRDAETTLDLGAAATEVRLATADGLELAASHVPSRNGAAVILFPRRGGVQEHARMLVRHGYGVLAVDMRGYGESEGDPNAFGWGSAKDIDTAVEFLRARPEVDDDAIGGLGLSVGGEQMLEAASRNAGLAAVVSEGAGERSVAETVIRGWKAALAIPQQAVLTAGVAALSGDAPPVSLEEAVAGIAPRATFLIHAEQGAGGEELTPDYFAAARAPKELWLVAGAGHTGGLDAQPGEYERRVVGFFDRHLPGRP